MSVEKRLAILEVSPEVLRDLLQLPPGVELLSVFEDFHSRGVMLLKVEGMGEPVKLGACVPRIRAVIREERRPAVYWGCSDASYKR